MKVLAKLKREPGLWLSTAEKPVCGDDEVLVKIHKTAICGTDLHIYNWDEWAQKTVPVPIHVGHEFVGHIVELGSKVQGLQVGERVSGEGHITCGYCRNCRAGQRHLCPRTKGIGYDCEGAFAEYLALPAVNICQLPDAVSDDIASILDPLGNAVHTALSFDLIGEDVLITGAGPVGIMAAAIAMHVGARHVVITDINPKRLALAEKMGVTCTVNPLERSLDDVMQQLGMKEGFDIGMEMSGSPDAFRDMLAHMSNGGKIAFLGVPAQDFSIDWHQVVFKSLVIKGVYGREMFETWYKMINLLESGLDVYPIITHTYPVDEFEKGFEAMLAGDAGKVILEW